MSLCKLYFESREVSSDRQYINRYCYETLLYVNTPDPAATLESLKKEAFDRKLMYDDYYAKRTSVTFARTSRQQSAQNMIGSRPDIDTALLWFRMSFAERMDHVLEEVISKSYPDVSMVRVDYSDKLEHPKYGCNSTSVFLGKVHFDDDRTGESEDIYLYSDIGTDVDVENYLWHMCYLKEMADDPESGNCETMFQTLTGDFFGDDPRGALAKYSLADKLACLASALRHYHPHIYAYDTLLEFHCLDGNEMIEKVRQCSDK